MKMIRMTIIINEDWDINGGIDDDTDEGYDDADNDDDDNEGYDDSYDEAAPRCGHKAVD